METRSKGKSQVNSYLTGLEKNQPKSEQENWGPQDKGLPNIFDRRKTGILSGFKCWRVCEESNQREKKEWWLNPEKNNIKFYKKGNITAHYLAHQKKNIYSDNNADSVQYYNRNLER